MTLLVDVATALANRLRTIPGLSAYDYVPGSAEWPGAFVQPPAIEYEGLDLSDGDCRLEVVLLVGAATDRNQLRLLPFMDVGGDWSIPALLQANRSLGFPDVDVFALRARPLGLQEQASYQAWGAAFELQVRVG